MNIRSVALRGCNSQPFNVGLSGEFYPRQFVTERSKWREIVSRYYWSGLDEMEAICERTGNGTSIGGLRFIHEHGFVYAYQVGSYGDLCSVAYTHEAIAGDAENYIIPRKWEEVI